MIAFKYLNNIKVWHLFAALVATILLIMSCLVTYRLLEPEWNKGYRQGLADGKKADYLLALFDPGKRFCDGFNLIWFIDPVLGGRCQPRPAPPTPAAMTMFGPSPQELARVEEWHDGYEAGLASVRNTAVPVHEKIMRTSADQWIEMLETDGDVAKCVAVEGMGRKIRITRGPIGVRVSVAEHYGLDTSGATQYVVLNQKRLKGYQILKADHDFSRLGLIVKALYIYDDNGEKIATISRYLRKKEIAKSKSHDI